MPPIAGRPRPVRRIAVPIEGFVDGAVIDELFDDGSSFEVFQGFGRQALLVQLVRQGPPREPSSARPPPLTRVPLGRRCPPRAGVAQPTLPVCSGRPVTPRSKLQSVPRRDSVTINVVPTKQQFVGIPSPHISVSTTAPSATTLTQ